MRRGKKAKEKRQMSALKGQEARNKRTDEQQIRKLNREGWTATKERARLAKRIKEKVREFFDE